jgi:hypothetical protein
MLMGYSQFTGDESTVRFPVTCIKCGQESLSAFRVSVVAINLIKLNKMILEAKCCGVVWDASPAEMEQIREYWGAVCLNDQLSAGDFCRPQN